MVALPLPAVVKFREDLWDSRPFDENYLQTVYGKKFYKLDEAECRITLINVLSVLDRFGFLETEMQRQMEESISSMFSLLAMNIRSSQDQTPLVDSFNDRDSLVDSHVAKGMERPISARYQLSIELQNAVRNVKRFEVVAPIVAWEAIRYFAGRKRQKVDESQTGKSTGLPTLPGDTVQSEIVRWKKMGVEVAVPRGCLRFLEKRLPQLEDFTLLRRDILSVVKSTALFLKRTPCSAEDPADLMFRQQLRRFSRVFIAPGLGPWLLVNDIAKGRVGNMQYLVEALKAHRTEIAGQSSDLAKAVDVLSVFASTLASQISSSQNPHLCYSVQCGMLSFLDGERERNRVLVQFLQDISDRLKTLEASSAKSESRTTEVVGELSVKVAELYGEMLRSTGDNEVDEESGLLPDFWTDECSVETGGRSARKKRNRKR